MEGPVFLESERLVLCPLVADGDLSAYAEWVNDPESTTFMGSGRFPQSVDSLRAYIRGYEQDRNGILLGIFEKESGVHVGNVALHSIDWVHRNGELGVIIGDKAARGKGYALEAMRMLCRHAYDRLNMHKITGGVVKGNDAALKMDLKLGFEVEGELREQFFLEGRFVDVYRLGMLRSDFEAACAAQSSTG